MPDIDISVFSDTGPGARLIRFEGTPRDRRNAFVIGPEGYGGDDAPSVRRDTIARSGQHGAHEAPGYRDARVIPLSGWIVAESPLKLQHMRNRLASVLAYGQAGRMTIHRPLGSVWAKVMLADTPVIKVRGASECEASFQIQFWAPDPRLYGEVHEYAAGQTAIHYGNFPAAPELIVTGPKPGGYTITGPGGRQYIVTQSLAAGQTHRIDMVTGWLYLDGVLQSGAVSQARTWEVPPGLPGAVHTITGGTGSLTVRLTDTFV